MQVSTRDFANKFFNNDELETLDADAERELRPIQRGLNTIKRYFDELDPEKHPDLIDFKKQFAAFIMDKVMFMVTEMPANIDENKLFEVSNNRGVQLQHHEILKASLLSFIPDVSTRTKYAQLWEACSMMDNYIEKNIKDISGLTWSNFTGNPTNEEREVGLPDNIFDILGAKQNEYKQGLLDILKIDNITKTSGSQVKDTEYSSKSISSIVSFPMLILHTLRIFQHQNLKDKEVTVAPVDEKRLLVIFDDYFFKYYSVNKVNTTSANEMTCNFIDLLWKIRVAFDKHIIKWVEIDKVKIHGIERLYLSNVVLVRKAGTTNDNGFALLQSMLYHSQEIITHYWLTPLLHKMLSCNDASVLYKYLRQLDNEMFCSGRFDLLSIRSWEMLSDPLENSNVSVEKLGVDTPKGVNYPSYPFYKMDFVLWYLRDSVFEELKLKETKKEDWLSYRFTAKNSIEHISPQNPKKYDAYLIWSENDTDEDKKRKLDDFGNLVLLTSSMNSEYSNNIYTTKRSEFLAKANNRRIDSLKSAVIFENDEWSWQLCNDHRTKMKDYLNQYFNK